MLRQGRGIWAGLHPFGGRAWRPGPLRSVQPCSRACNHAITHGMACVRRPYESGEVIVQPYNTLLTLSHLAELADGVVLMENDALHRVCTRLYNLPRPSFSVSDLLSRGRGREGGGGQLWPRIMHACIHEDDTRQQHANPDSWIS